MTCIFSGYFDIFMACSVEIKWQIYCQVPNRIYVYCLSLSLKMHPNVFLSNFQALPQTHNNAYVLRRIRNLCACCLCLCPNEWKELKQNKSRKARHERVQISADKNFLNLDQLGVNAQELSNEQHRWKRSTHCDKNNLIEIRCLPSEERWVLRNSTTIAS